MEGLGRRKEEGGIRQGKQLKKINLGCASLGNRLQRNWSILGGERWDGAHDSSYLMKGIVLPLEAEEHHC